MCCWPDSSESTSMSTAASANSPPACIASLRCWNTISSLLPEDLISGLSFLASRRKSSILSCLQCLRTSSKIGSKSSIRYFGGILDDPGLPVSIPPEHRRGTTPYRDLLSIIERPTPKQLVVRDLP